MLALLVSAGSANSAVVKSLDYETGNFSQWSNIQAKPEQTAIVQSPRKQGKYAARFVVRPGDVRLGKGERAEVLFHTGEKDGVESWWKWSTLFPADFRPYAGAMNIFAQWHHKAPTCHPPMQFVVDGTKNPARLQLRVSGGRINLATCKVEGGGGIWDLGALQRGRWQTFVMRVRWSPSRTKGFVNLWRNGTQVVPFTRTPTMFAGYEVYVKQGYYRRPANWSATIYHDGLTRYDSRPRSLR